MSETESTQKQNYVPPPPIASSGDILLSIDNLTAYKDGRVERRPHIPPPVAANENPPPGGSTVATKDVTISSDHATWIRLYLPQSESKSKLPVLLYFHGGGFAICSTALPFYHSFLERLATEARVLIVSVDYRLAPEHRLPAAYEDCYEALTWLESPGVDPWLVENADFARVFIGGDSAGANIVHHVAMKALLGLGFGAGERLSAPPLKRLEVKGLIFIHPFFTCGGPETTPVLKEFWELSGAAQDHRFADPLRGDAMGAGGGDGCGLGDAWPMFPASLVLVAEKDVLRTRGVIYHKDLLERGRAAELFESPDEDHVFFLFCPASKNVRPFLQKLCAFLNP